MYGQETLSCQCIAREARAAALYGTTSPSLSNFPTGETGHLLAAGHKQPEGIQNSHRLARSPSAGGEELSTTIYHKRTRGEKISFFRADKIQLIQKEGHMADKSCIFFPCREKSELDINFSCTPSSVRTNHFER